MDSKNHSKWIHSHWMINTIKVDVMKNRKNAKTIKNDKMMKRPLPIHHHMLCDTLNHSSCGTLPQEPVMSPWHSGIPEENIYIDPKLTHVISWIEQNDWH